MDELFIPEGTSGVWSVEHFTVGKRDAEIERVRALFSSSSRGRFTPEGQYMRLRRNGRVIMSNTPDELRDLREFKFKAKGRVLINGLGLGCAAMIALDKPSVEHVTVIELSSDVVALVEPHLCSDRLTVINADAYQWQPPKGERYGAVWHDIWDDICGDNLDGMKRLHRKYGRLTDWQGSWCRYLCERAA